MDGWIVWLRHDWPLIASLAVCFLVGASMERALGRVRRRRPRRSGLARTGTVALAFDSAAQLRVVERAAFSRQRLLNRGEARLLRVLDAACAAEAPAWRVMAQVSMGEILASEDADAYRAINSKRIDFLLVDADCHARLAIEFQGSGHHAGPAATRDAIKKEALRRAGIVLAEVMPGDTPADVRAIIARIAGREAPSQPTLPQRRAGVAQIR